MDLHHLPFWGKVIEKISEKEFAQSDILDFGCNRGGFLRLLHKVNPFKRAVGIDIAVSSVAHANQQLSGEPIEYKVVDDLGLMSDTFDIATSYEVIYLLPDLQRHARDMKKVLRKGGVYYAATGCHTDCQQWKKCHEQLLVDTNLKPFDYSLDDYRSAFMKEGFEVSAVRLQFDDFVRVDSFIEYFPTVSDSLEYFERGIVVFRFVNTRK